MNIKVTITKGFLGLFKKEKVMQGYPRMSSNGVLQIMDKRQFSERAEGTTIAAYTKWYKVEAL